MHFGTALWNCDSRAEETSSSQDLFAKQKKEESLNHRLDMEIQKTSIWLKSHSVQPDARRESVTLL